MGPRAASWQDMWLTNFRKPANHRFEGRSIAQTADMLDKDPITRPWTTLGQLRQWATTVSTAI